MPAPEPPPELFPTRTRLALLRMVAVGEVQESRRFPYESYVGSQKVTFRADELYRAGWITPDASRDWEQWRPWKLTDRGREILDQHPEGK